MDILTDTELNAIVASSRLVPKYNAVIDSQSAYEMLNAKLAEAAESAAPVSTTPSGRAPKVEKSTLEKVLDNSVFRQVGRTAAGIITRSLLGALGLGGRSRKS